MKIHASVNSKVPKSKPKYQYLATFFATFSIMTSAMHYGWPSPSIPKLLDGSSQLTLTDEEGSWVAVMPLIGAVVGAISAGSLLDKIGRKKTILLTGVPYIVSWVIIAFCKNVELMYTARFLAGIADGLTFTAVPMYLGEIADPNIRGLLGSSCSIFLITGVLLINGLGLYMSVSVTALISTIMPIMLLITFSFMPESPYYSIMKDKYDEAKKNLKILKGIDDVDHEVNRLANAVKQQASETGSMMDLFKVASNRKAVIIMIGLRTVQQLSGITAITFYTKTIFDDAKTSISSELTTIIYYSVQLILTCMSSLILDKAGRRPLMIFSTIGIIISLSFEGAYLYIDSETSIDVSEFTYIPVIALLTFIIAYSIGMGTIPVLMLGELFPTDVKAFALSLADIYFSVIAAVVSKFFQIMKDNFGMYVPFFCFTICTIFGLVFVLITLPETKGKTLEEIQDILKGVNSSESEENGEESEDKRGARF
ncbi:PREDICTED: facilitated trehalose transporter Tret1-like [Nicrophorus vespilloides]|uniref:Facilitated trehalose transporter Tret1-like n=1 Tax=Nicrophorus vespilloides TaxID=110193 RepID=A0ABM1M963_NICVS|nr:PREDICTED: facilitated trehalose transporter Tret1-like [Nicrophorus vespilloides]